MITFDMNIQTFVAKTITWQAFDIQLKERLINHKKQFQYGRNTFIKKIFFFYFKNTFFFILTIDEEVIYTLNVKFLSSF
jgi:hypothetical protein